MTSGVPKLKHSLLERLVHYLHVLVERHPDNEREYFSSAHVAALLHMDDTQIRKDLAAVGVRGYPRLGFRTLEAREAIRRTLGFNCRHRAILVGAGHLGGALAAYKGFAGYGIQWVGIFDADSDKHGTRFGRLVVQPLSRLHNVARKREIHLAVIAVPSGAAQDVANQVVTAGINTLWNFAPMSLVVPSRVYVRNEHISVGLGELSYHLKQSADPPC